jgi:tetratricopeptide (TPR) repeat protein
MARLDRLGAAKEVAQIGAAIGRDFSHGLLSAVVGKPEPELVRALDRLIATGLLFRHGVPPHASYLFKHALVQDAAYGALLRAPRRALHGRIADTLERQFREVAQSQPELLARHYTEAGALEKAAGFWGKAGQRSLARSALVEAAEQVTQALAQIAILPGTPTWRREEINLQAVLRHALMHLKGYAAPETKAAMERTRLLIEQAEALGEPPEDPLLLFSLLNGLWTANIVAFNGDAACELAAQFLAHAERQNLAGPLIDGHRLLGTSLLMTGDISEGRAHFDRGIALDHSPLATSLGDDAKVVTLGFRSIVLWLLGHPKAALADADQALSEAREIEQVGTLMHTLSWISLIRIPRGNYVAASTLVDELVALADEKDTLFWKAWGMMTEGWLSASTGKASDAVHKITSGIAAWRSTEATAFLPFYLSCLAKACAQLGQLEEARLAVGEAITTIERTKERWFEAEINRVTGEIALMSLEPDAAKAESYFERALAVARTQRTKSWELRAATNMARLWRDQGKRAEARQLLAPVYGWFTEGFDTRDLKEAKALLDELAA